MTRNPHAIKTTKTLTPTPPPNTVPPTPRELTSARITTPPLTGLTDQQIADLLNATGQPLDDRLPPNPAHAGRWTPDHVRAARALP